MYAVRRALGGLILAIAGLLVCAPLGLAGLAGQTDVVGESQRVSVGPEPAGEAVTLDVSVWRPATGGPFPAVLLAHGFGGSTADLVERGRALAARGYLAVGYSARGFGDSGGRIHLNDPAYEIADARVLVDLIAGRPDVRTDGPADPHVGVVGASYGGALALMLGSTDPRIDSVVAVVTWHDLADAFFPQHAVAAGAPNSAASANSAASPGPGAASIERLPEPGPFKQLWASRFFAAGSQRSASAGSSPSTSADVVCGRFDPEVCTHFLAAAETGNPSPALLAMLRAHSPRPLLAGLRAPTYLVQGMRDSLFGIEHADATARAIDGQVPALAVRWIDGGHDGVSSTADADEQALRDWLAQTLSPDPRSSPDPSAAPSTPDFVYAAPIPRRQSAAPLVELGDYPGTATWTTAPFADPQPARLASPPGGQPASVTTVPGVGALIGGAAAYQLAALAGQSAAFDTTAFTERSIVVGSPRVGLTVTSSRADVVLFVSLWQVTGAQPTLTRRLVAPVRLTVTPGQPTAFTVALPPATWTVEAGSSLRLLVTTTDTTYAVPREARVDEVRVASGLLLPRIEGAADVADGGSDTEAIGVAVAIALLLAAIGASAWWDRRKRQHVPDRPDLADVPLVVDRLVKTYADGHRAVDDVSWRAERGQVVGLLGPNGAGKTTTLRMALGLITPDSGSVYLGGQPVHPGSPALAGVGALVEGPGLLPHLTGRDNLHAYWAATGRPDAEAAFEQALDVAALGGAIDRPVRAYSHGMRQRLGIAQAMLGLPDLLVLDEPTNGLDPPQIAAMRPILQRYAASGRTVVISSHLLAEVEQTCSHVVVMHAGRVVLTGRVADLVDASDTTVIHLDPAASPHLVTEVADRVRADAAVTSVAVVEDEGDCRLVITAASPRADVVRAVIGAGADVVGVSSRKHLEEVFLGVIAAAQTERAGQAGEPGSGQSGQSGSSDWPDRPDGTSESITEQLRQVRAR
ncbi:MAG: alpha/beta fold hydrolase [Candidatus Phosphoribacter sp.]